MHTAWLFFVSSRKLLNYFTIQIVKLQNNVFLIPWNQMGETDIIIIYLSIEIDEVAGVGYKGRSVDF